MSGDDRILWVLMLENALLQHRGQAFEDFFVKAANVLWGQDFEPWRTQGSFGDMKCDGYRISEKTVFQCFAPEQFVASKVLNKIQSDFSGARDSFGNKMQKWVFVHNHKGGLPTKADMYVLELRDEHPNIKIEIWTPDNLIQLLLDLPNNKLGNLFPHLPSGQNFSKAARESFEKSIKENRVAVPGIDAGPEYQLNRLALDDALDTFGEDDRDVRRRVLGYSRWFEPVNKIEIFKKLAGFGHEQELIENNAQRLREADLIQITENHYLPMNVEICQQAAESLMDEILQNLDE